MKKKRLFLTVRLLLLAVTVPILLLAAALLVFSAARSYDVSRTAMLDNQAAVLNNVFAHLEEVRQRTRRELSSMEFLFFCNSSAPDRINQNARLLTDALRNSLAGLPEVEGVVLYHTATDRLYPTVFDVDGHIPEGLFARRSGSAGYIRQETETRLSADGSTLLVFSAELRYGNLAVVFNPARNEGYRTLRQLHGNGLRLIPLAEAASDPDRRTIVTRHGDLDLALEYRVPDLLRFTGQDAFLIAIFLVLLLLVGMTLLMFVLANRFVLAPLKHLSDAFRRLGEGDTAYRIRQSSSIEEIDRFYTGFDRAMDSLQAAEQESRRQQLGAVQAQLQYLQLQIRPHFYLNCLKTISFLAQTHQDEKIQTLVMALSNYFRYTFQDVNGFVTVREELSSIQSYVELCRSLYTDIDLRFDVESDVLDKQCLPLGILTFAENAIKHRRDRGSLTIRVAAWLEKAEPRRIRVRVQNSGPFSEEALALLNSTPRDRVPYQKEHVGVANVSYRLWLVYGERCTLDFHNEGDMATVDLAYPAIPLTDVTGGEAK